LNPAYPRAERGTALTIPNILSIFRIVLIPIYAWFYFSDYKSGALIAGIVLTVSGLTDLFDGAIARKFNQISELGKVLDPIADKLTQVAVFICLFFKFPYLLPLFCFIVYKEILMLSGGLVVLKKGFVVTAKWWGKTTTFLIYCAVAAFTFFPGLPRAAILAISALLLAMLAFSMWGYSEILVGVFAKSALTGRALKDIAQETY